MNSPLVPLGRPRAERADAARNRAHLLTTAREMMAELGVEKVTMDGLAERAGLGKGTVYRRFGTRAGIFHALLDDDEHVFQEQVLSGPPPLGPGAEPIARLIAYGRARTAYLADHLAIVRASLDRNKPVPAGAGATLTRMHLRLLLRLARPDATDIDVDALALQLTAALEGPFMLYLSAPRPEEFAGTPVADRLGDSWQTLVESVCRT
ncbi:TetR/AcrR family transcriptional regulator [Streptomyces longispororuber]|uniref:TetR/AcrR family transcriptional regulator n=1 Tax=Streptomyces longispororuber TaxID=68230 RepID=UPI002109ACE4|nr:TetR/AcrR family transcriptional regulator [Streptomyces longispororuber]MCQ4214711.1 TetR/AcrR family transcriptional regulator [Streptomyces longispororuber]